MPISFICFLVVVSFVSLSLPTYEPPEAASVRCPRVARALRNLEREGNVRLGDKQKDSVQVCAKLFCPAIYSANPRLKPDSKSGSLSHRGLGRRDPQIIR